MAPPAAAGVAVAAFVAPPPPRTTGRGRAAAAACWGRVRARVRGRVRFGLGLGLGLRLGLWLGLGLGLRFEHLLVALAVRVRVTVRVRLEHLVVALAVGSLLAGEHAAHLARRPAALPIVRARAYAAVTAAARLVLRHALGGKDSTLCPGSLALSPTRPLQPPHAFVICHSVSHYYGVVETLCIAASVTPP